MGSGKQSLFIPGPIDVKEEILQELGREQISHRSDEFRDLFKSLKPGLKELFGSPNDVLISTSSGSGFWEAASRCCVCKKILHAVNGAFSEKWAEVSAACGKEVKRIVYEPSKGVRAEDVEKALLENPDLEAFAMVHNETSTGAASDLDAISRVMKNHPQVIWMVDAVSSLGGMRIDADRRGIDFCLSSSQKALALPPGLSLACVSQKAYDKAKTIKGRGYYFDILELKKAYDKDETPYTPSIPHLYALKRQLERISIEGFDERLGRHKEMAARVKAWAEDNDLRLFPEKGRESLTVSCIISRRGLDLKTLKRAMLERGYFMDAGYRKLNEKLLSEGKEPTFRIAHMGDRTMDELDAFLEALDECMRKQEIILEVKEQEKIKG
ncbi:alanine--glyoxylate aminotransferase family protein [Candidatus Woesearchaeota archaeon]|nr:alanine--glyoxylate aminotransferase family protein [Candidatus Woesearchaeota archaeon]